MHGLCPGAGLDGNQSASWRRHSSRKRSARSLRASAEAVIADPKAFIIANTRLLPVPYVPEICLYPADEVTPLWLKTEEELGEMGLPPPFWAFAWAGGQALARYILDHPNSVVGKRVLDFASGSGLVAIAAAKSGARA